MSFCAVGSHSVKTTWFFWVICPLPFTSSTSTPLPAPAQAVRCCQPSPAISKNVLEDDRGVILMPLPVRSRTTGQPPSPPSLPPPSPKPPSPNPSPNPPPK